MTYIVSGGALNSTHSLTCIAVRSVGHEFRSHHLHSQVSSGQAAYSVCLFCHTVQFGTSGRAVMLQS